MTQITNVETLKRYADKHGLCPKRLRRLARKNEFPGNVQPFKFGGKNGLWCIATNAPMVVLPAKSTRGARRPDGRQRYVVFANATELDAIKTIVDDDNVIDPRIASKLRRDARKTVNAENDDTLYGVPMVELPDGTLIVKTENDDNG